MKKILLATTLLTMTASYAYADITWAGSATAGIAQNGTKKGGDSNPNCYAGTVDKAGVCSSVKGDDKLLSYSSATLAVTFAGQTDGGLTFGASLDLTSGVTYALADDDGFDTNGGAFGSPSVFLSGSFGKITFSTDNIDGFDGDELSVADNPATKKKDESVALDGVYDVQYDGTFGPVTASVEADLDTGLMAAKAAFATGALALSASYSQQKVQDDIYDVSATYTMGSLAITASTDDQSDASLGVAYAGASGISASATYNTNTGADKASYDLTAGYTANGLSVAASIDDVSGANGDATWTVTASYDLGGGLTVQAGTNYTNDMMVGASMSF